jgi:2-polyprenyl-6-methoxyphenol hydroxylase-like FAD-dependent oxidoreductase
MGRLLGQRAIVVGAGIGGLATAGALAKYFAEVDVLDRDILTPSVGSRSGTPQDRHSHGLLAGGLQALSEIYPGFDRISPKPALFRLRSRRKCGTNAQMLVFCRSGILTGRSCVRPDQ